jgi:hypothetical protein
VNDSGRVDARYLQRRRRVSPCFWQVSGVVALDLDAGEACAAVDFDEAPGSRCYGTWETIVSMYTYGAFLVTCSKMWRVWDGVVSCKFRARRYWLGNTASLTRGIKLSIEYMLLSWCEGCEGWRRADAFVPWGCQGSSPSYHQNDGVRSCRSSELSSFRNRWRTARWRSRSAVVTPEPAVHACGREF